MTSDAGVPGAPRFDVVLRGYDRRQVDEHVDRLQRVLARMRADLEVARSQPMPAVGPGQPARPRPTPRPRPGGPAGSPDTIGNFTDRMETILQSAEEEAAEIRRNAHVAARAETEGVRSQVADLIRQRDAVLAELTRMRSQLEGLLAAPTAQMPAHEPGRFDVDRPYGRPEPGPRLPEPGVHGQGADPAHRYGAPPATGPQPPVGPGPSGAQPPAGAGAQAPAAPKPAPAGSGAGQQGPSAGVGSSGPGSAAAPGSSPVPSSQGPSSQGPSSRGPSSQGSSSQGSSSQGSSSQGSSSQGPSSQGSAAKGSASPVPPSHGPSSQGPSQGPSSPGPAAPGPSSQGPASSKPNPATPSSSSAAKPAAGGARSDGSSPAQSSAPEPGSASPDPAPAGSTTILPTGVTPPPDRRNAGSGASGSKPGNGTPPSSGSGPAKATRPEREVGKAAHRLPTGAYPAVGENSSMRPRSEPDPEPADLFRPVARATSADPQTTAVPRGGAGSPAESTAKVGSVRPEEPTVLSPQPGTARPEPGDGRSGTSHPTTPSRSG